MFDSLLEVGNEFVQLGAAISEKQGDHRDRDSHFDVADIKFCTLAFE